MERLCILLSAQTCGARAKSGLEPRNGYTNVCSSAGIQIMHYSNMPTSRKLDVREKEIARLEDGVVMHEIRGLSCFTLPLSK